MGLTLSVLCCLFHTDHIEMLPSLHFLFGIVFLNPSLYSISQVDNLTANGEVTDNLSLQNLWNWLDAAKSLVIASNFKLPGGMPYRYQGVW